MSEKATDTTARPAPLQQSDPFSSRVWVALKKMQLVLGLLGGTTIGLVAGGGSMLLSLGDARWVTIARADDAAKAQKATDEAAAKELAALKDAQDAKLSSAVQKAGEKIEAVQKEVQTIKEQQIDMKADIRWMVRVLSPQAARQGLPEPPKPGADSGAGDADGGVR